MLRSELVRALRAWCRRSRCGVCAVALACASVAVGSFCRSRAGGPMFTATAAAPEDSHQASWRSFTRESLASLRQHAGEAPRGRFGKLLHKEFHERSSGADAATAAAEDVQRFLNVLARGSYVMPHMHPEPGKWEVFVHVDGDFNIVAFDAERPSDDAANAVETARLSSETPLVFVSEGCWHAIAALDDAGAVEFEFKPGPYGGVAKDKEFSYQLDRPWAYDEAAESAKPHLAEYTTRLEGATGSKASSAEDRYTLLRPYSREELLGLLGTAPVIQPVAWTGPGRVKPLARVLAVPPGMSVPANPDASGAWAVYVWLAGGSARVGGRAGPSVGPGAPLLEAWGASHGDVVAHGIRAEEGDVGAVLLELTASAPA